MGDEISRRTTYINTNIDSSLRLEVIKLLQEFKYFFAWNYDVRPSLSRDLVEQKLLIKHGKKLVKHKPIRFAPKVMFKIKEEIERLLKSKFTRTSRYAE